MANVPPASVVITSTTGAGQAITAKTINNVTNFSVDFKANTIRIETSDGLLQYFDYSAIATFTWVITGGIAVLTIS